MGSVLIPALCSSCGALFASRTISIGGNVENLTLSGNKETCPYCGGSANLADGVFDVAGNILSVVSAPNVTKQMLAAFATAVKKAYEERKPLEELAKEVEKIDPTFGEIIRKAGTNSRFYIVALLLTLSAIKSCSVDVKLDANQLIDQIRDKSPAAVTSAQPANK